MAGLCADDYPAVKLAKNRTFLLCRDKYFPQRDDPRMAG
jgi:hypothetical protein